MERYYALTDIMAYPRKKSRLTDLVTPLKPLEANAQMLRMVGVEPHGINSCEDVKQYCNNPYVGQTARE